MRATRWRRLIRRSRLEHYLRSQSDLLTKQGATQGAFVLHQLAENMRMGMSLSLPSPDPPTEEEA